MSNFAAKYNHRVDCYNSSSFEVNYENMPRAKHLRGSHFLYQRTFIIIYLIIFIVYWVTWPQPIFMPIVLLIICLIHWILLFYNLYTIIKNGNLIAKNFIYSKELCPESKNEFYDIELSAIERNASLATDLSILCVSLRENKIESKVGIMAYKDEYMTPLKPYRSFISYFILHLIMIVVLCNLISKAGDE